MQNECIFSADRKHRYALIHRMNPLFESGRSIMWIGLNPSTADENQLDPTLRRIAAYSLREGFDSFVMTNLFAWRDTDPQGMKSAADPIGSENDKWLIHYARKCEVVVAAWGTHGSFMMRDEQVIELLSTEAIEMTCLHVNEDGSPAHPLYLRKDLPLVGFAGKEK